MAHFRLLPTLIAVSFALPLGSVSAQPAPENESALLREMLRVLTVHGSDAQILVGQIPDSLPEDLPIPEGAEPIASIVDDSLNTTRILFRVAQSEEVSSFYQQQLLDADWYLDSSSEPQGFFTVPPSEDTASESQYIPPTYCSPSESTVLSVSLTPTQSQGNPRTLVDLQLLDNSDFQFSTCSQNATGIPVPDLPPPTGAFLGTGHAGSGSNSYAADVVIETDLDAEALINHYNSQFQQANWTQIDGGEGELSRWSIWSFQDETGRSWGGLLIITEFQDVSNRYLAFVQTFTRSPDN